MTESFSNQISSVLCSAPETFDPEDEVDDTKARVVTEQVDTFEDVYSGASNLRRKNISLLDNEDERYLGKPESRKQIFGKDEWEGEDDAGSSEDQDDNQSDVSDEGDSEDDSLEEDSASYDDNDQLGTDNDSDAGADEQTFKQFEDSSDQANKGSCVRNQLSLWENFLEIRIQLQKCLLTANKMPQSDHFNKLAEEGGNEFHTSANESKKNIVTALDKFLTLQSMLLRKYPETKNMLADSKTGVNGNKEEHSDEEIPSDTENEEEQESDTDEPHTKKLKLSDYSSEISKRFETYRSYRNSVIHKWNDKTRIASSKPGSAAHSVISQIDHILSDKDKLMKRTQQKRLEYKILGELESEQIEDETDLYAPTYNKNIFDDTDFYHQLLRELIEFKSSDITDPIQLGQQWMKLQSMRSKMKRKIDTSATKGRKIKYVVHSKLVNFMPPIEQITWQDNAKTELYSSLFSKTVVQVAT